MNSSYLLLALLSLLLFADTMEGRKDPAETLVLHPSSLQVLSSEKSSHCHDRNLKHGDEELFLKDFEPRPSLTAYPDDDNEKIFVDFEPRPSLTAYPDDDNEKIFVVDFEPRPSLTAYPDEIKTGEEVLSKTKNPSFSAEFEPRPDLTSYHG